MQLQEFFLGTAVGAVVAVLVVRCLNVKSKPAQATQASAERRPSTTQDVFKKSAEAAKGLPSSISNEEKLKLYGRYKQATLGDVAGSKPGIFDQTGRAKWEAWEKQKGKDKNTVIKEYMMMVESLQMKYAVS